MRQPARNSTAARRKVQISGAVGLLLLLGLLFASAASAAFEQVDTWGEETHPTGPNGPYGTESTRGLAVNVSGAGGAPAGTLYRVGRANGEPGVTTFNSKGEQIGHWGMFYAEGVAVDQTTGNVYVLRDRGSAGTNQMEVYNADGSELITSFGPQGAFNETVAEGPEKIHSVSASSIAVDSSGVVYVADFPAGIGTSRVMVFKPQSPGDYSHYAYAGQEHDIAVGKGVENLAIDSAGNLYANAEGEVSIEKYSPSQPNTPTCRYETPSRGGGILGMTVNPTNGEVFYYSAKNKKIHQLAPCNGEGKILQSAEFTATPKPSQIEALAFNPALSWDAGRPPGVLYGAAVAGGLNPGDLRGQGYIFAAPVARAPKVEEESVSSVGSSTAVLNAQINPNGSTTRYAFQYISQAAYEENEPSDRFAGASEAPLGGTALSAAGTEALHGGAALVGLQPDTTYHYRAIATSHCEPDDEAKICEDTGKDQSFHTFALEASGLPDRRAYELVSPTQKFGGEPFPARPGLGSCENEECKPGYLISERFPLQSSPNGEALAYQGFPFSAAEGNPNLDEYISRRSASGWQTTNLTPSLYQANVGAGFKAFDPSLSTGLIQQVTGPPLTPEAPSGYANLYSQPTADRTSLSPLMLAAPPNRPEGPSFNITYAGASEDLSQAFFAANDALTEASEFAPEALDGGKSKDNLYESAGGELRLVNVLPGNAATVPGAVFGSGFQLAEGKGGAAADYSHAISNDGSRVFWSDQSGQVYLRENGETTREIPDHTGKFLTAAADGSKLLLNNGHLFDIADEEPMVDLTEGKGGFLGIAGQSEDLTRIYFVDTAVLSEAPNENGNTAQAGANNVYSWQGGSSAFIATLGENNVNENSAANWLASPVRRSAEASPDGHWLALASRTPLTPGLDNRGPCGAKRAPDKCNEAYLYDSASGRLICASCNPSGARPLGNTPLPGLEGSPGSLPQMRYLTDQGRLFFDSADSLTPQDANGRVEDVYQYEPQGIGSCKHQGGCINLISAGHEPVDSNFAASDETGKNVFFTSRDQLVLRDRDDLLDVYDAREGGGIAAESEVARTECQGEACQAAISPPNDPTPGSSTFEGAGNVVEKAAKKHKHKKKHKHAKKHAQKRANNNRGGAK
jgi:hypothetical protein